MRPWSLCPKGVRPQIQRYGSARDPLQPGWDGGSAQRLFILLDSIIFDTVNLGHRPDNVAKLFGLKIRYALFQGRQDKRRKEQCLMRSPAVAPAKAEVEISLLPLHPEYFNWRQRHARLQQGDEILHLVKQTSDVDFLRRLYLREQV